MSVPWFLPQVTSCRAAAHCPGWAADIGAMRQLYPVCTSVMCFCVCVSFHRTCSLCNHHSRDTERSIRKTPPTPLRQPRPSPFFPSFLATTNPFSVFVILSFQECHIRDFLGSPVMKAPRFPLQGVPEGV